MLAFILLFTVCGIIQYEYAYSITFLMIVIAYQLVARRSIKVNFFLNVEIWLLLAFGLFYGIFKQFNFSNFKFIVLPFMAYTIGWVLVEKKKDVEIRIINYVLAISSGCGVHAALNYYINKTNLRYGLIDFWTGDVYVATVFGVLNTFIFSISFYILFVENIKIKKYIGIFFMIVSFLYCFILGNRTQIYIFVITFGIGILCYVNENCKKKEVLKILGTSIIICIILWICYCQNILGVRSAIANSNLFLRFSNTESLNVSDRSRFRLFVNGLKDIFDHPFGQIGNTDYHHNMWLDVNRVSGVIPMLCLIVYSIKTCYHAWYLVNSRNVDVRIRYLLMGLYIGTMLNFFVEPIIEGVFWFFLAFCINNGMVDYLYYKRKRNTFFDVKQEIIK